MHQRLDCGHHVEVEMGERLFCHYDMTFGVVEGVGYEPDPWHDFAIDGSPYKPAGSHASYNAQRLACIPCGKKVLEVSRAVELGEGWVVVARQEPARS